MKYFCNSCKKEFEFDAQLSFCPYCGGSIVGENNITQTIDSIWGETASLKKEFTSLIFTALRKVGMFFDEQCEKIKAKYLKDQVEVPIYNEEIKMVSTCETRKSILAQVEKLMEKIRKTISAVPQNCIMQEEVVTVENEQNSVQVYLDCIAELVDDKKLFAVQEGKYQYTTIYKKQKFDEFFEELKIAHKKYEKCVNDNNMFAAFPANSDFGNIGRGNVVNLFFMDGDDIKEKMTDEKVEELDFEICLSRIKEANALLYYGFLDEDFVPHVDAYWRGVSDILGLLAANNNVSLILPSLNIDEKVKSRIRRKIATKEFFVTNEKIELLQRLIEDI